MEAIHEKRKFPRFPVTNSVIFLRYGRRMTMRTLDMSLGGLKLEANFDLRVGESIDFVILANATKIHCRGKIVAIEEFGHKVHARLLLKPSSDSEHRKLSDYLHTLYWGRFQKWIIAGILILSAYIAYLIIRT
ncbi:MAG: PilZ domain-containing protein [Syntrophobacterales bacterium]|nr:MAG: PilZ domain-containing protein [Syntrophobacterales bacterium]